MLDTDINLSDHRPIIVDYHCNDSVFNDIYSCRGSFIKSKASDCVPWLRWDHANLDMYRKLTEASLRPIYDELKEIELYPSVSAEIINHIYDKLIYT